MSDAEREELLSRWAKSPSETEQKRAENAERVVKAAIDASVPLQARDIRVFTQGSYRNNTNVRMDSDVDVCVCLLDTVTTDYHFAPALNNMSMGHGPVIYARDVFKNDVERALAKAFKAVNVTRGDKAFNVRENTYRITADVVACLEHLRYQPDGTSEKGTTVITDSGKQINNWPDQQYTNGVWKNNATGYRFKRLVRVMKNLRNTMSEEGDAAAEAIPSFLNECLVWNVPNDKMGSDMLSDDVRRMLIFLWGETETDEKCNEWGEVNEFKYLFRPQQPWTRDQVRNWTKAAWNWLGYK